MTDHSKLLLRLLEKLFPEKDEREMIAEILQEYGSEEYQREIDRVRVAILKLAGKNPDQVRDYTLLACTDYRDVIAGAEYPGEIGHYPWKEKDPARLEQIRAEDLEQYRNWYLEVLWEGNTVNDIED